MFNKLKKWWIEVRKLTPYEFDNRFAVPVGLISILILLVIFIPIVFL